MWSRVVVAERLVYRKKVVEKGSKHECWVIGIGRELPKKVSGHMNLAGKVHGEWGVLVFGFGSLARLGVSLSTRRSSLVSRQVIQAH